MQSLPYGVWQNKPISKSPYKPGCHGADPFPASRPQKPFTELCKAEEAQRQIYIAEGLQPQRKRNLFFPPLGHSPFHYPMGRLLWVLSHSLKGEPLPRKPANPENCPFPIQGLQKEKPLLYRCVPVRQRQNCLPCSLGGNLMGSRSISCGITTT